MKNETSNLGMKAKDLLRSFVQKMDFRLVDYWNGEIRKDFGFDLEMKEMVRDMLLHAKEHNLRTSKRLRSAFVYYGYGLGSFGNDEEIWKVCEAVELIHTSLLIHDDFMDRDEMRRGRQTTQNYFAKGDSHYGESMAVCLGDAILCLGYERFLEAGFKKAKLVASLKQLLRGITKTAFGQAFDVSLGKKEKYTEEMVLGLQRAKTAIYTYENPLVAGALLGGASEGVLQILKDYSLQGGIAFQIQDDVLGVFGDEEKTGKSNNSDLLQGKVTLLLVKALEKATDGQKKILLKVWGNEKARLEDIEAAKKVIVETGSYDYSVRLSKRMAEEAVKIVRKLRVAGCSEESVDFLEGIAEYLSQREV